MTVRDLIAKLKGMPEDAEVWYLWNGMPRARIDEVWVSRKGPVVASASGQPCFKDEARPHEAPDSSEDFTWAFGVKKDDLLDSF